MQTVYLSLGSNLDNRLLNLEAALLRITQTLGRVQAVSRVYVSKAFDMKDATSPDFYNIVCRLKTGASPLTILASINSLELSRGRERSKKGALSRSLDIDILFCQNEIIKLSNKLANLEIPHSKVCERDFVLLPFGDVVENGWHHPESKLSYNQLLEAFNKSSHTKNIFSNFNYSFL
ncbi:MAG: 2-amino-4-hydroxy-6-hydroxymethyldihydropteridine diphosphokinase [Candidatus Caenarcaniphilales bacterium]|nr:2-amino-4-hydroxy-6-hydroxymethyldihydropteridine diphosphokinase [Candidatus Caenarcaniphilales bacterium]